MSALRDRQSVVDLGLYDWTRDSVIEQGLLEGDEWWRKSDISQRALHCAKVRVPLMLEMSAVSKESMNQDST